MTATAESRLIAGAEVVVGGRPLPEALARSLVEVRVDDNLMLPDAFLVRLADPGLENVDSIPLEVGAEIEIRMAASDARALTTVLKGQVATLEPEFSATGAIFAARGYDHSHALHRTARTRTYQNMTAADIARRIAQDNRLRVGTVDAGGAVHDFVQQSQETDWAFLWRLATDIDFEVVVADRTLHFRRAGPAQGPAVTLTWGQTLLAFRPRITGIQQVDEVVVRGWDPSRKAAIEGTSRGPAPDSRAGIARDDVASALGGGVVRVGDRAVTSQPEADALAESMASRLLNAAVEADGTSQGDARLRAGTSVTIDGVGRRFGGTFVLSSTTHVFRGSQGYRTHFTVSGRTPRSLLDLMAPADPRRWSPSLAVGVVTQNQDPDKLGRVRVKYPALGDDTEGWWARVAAPSAGDHRGFAMTPVPGEEVVVGFEHGDTRRPYVLGSLFNGTQMPGDLAQTDGSFALRSDEHVRLTAKQDMSMQSEDGGMRLEAKGDIALSSDADLTVETDGKVTSKASGDVQVEGAKVTIKAGSGSVAIEGSGEVSIKAGGASVKLSSGGMVQVSGSQIKLG